METYFTTKELSEYLKIAEQTIRRWVMNNEIYYIRIHNVIRFRLSEVEAWIDENREKLPWMQEGSKERDLFNEAEAVEDAKGGDETEAQELSEETGSKPEVNYILCRTFKGCKK